MCQYIICSKLNLNLQFIMFIQKIKNVYYAPIYIPTILPATPWRGCFQFIDIYISLTYPFLLFLYVHHCAITRWTMTCLYVIQGNNCRSCKMLKFVEYKSFQLIKYIIIWNVEKLTELILPKVENMLFQTTLIHHDKILSDP